MGVERDIVAGLIDIIARDPENRPDNGSLLTTTVHFSLLRLGCKPDFIYPENEWPFAQTHTPMYRKYGYLNTSFRFIVLHDSYGFFIEMQTVPENYILILCPIESIPYYNDIVLDEVKFNNITKLVNNNVITILSNENKLPNCTKTEKGLIVPETEVLPSPRGKRERSLNYFPLKFFNSLPDSLKNSPPRSMLVNLLKFLYKSEYFMRCDESERSMWGDDFQYSGELITFFADDKSAIMSVLEHVDHFYVTFRNSEDNLLSYYKLSVNYVPELTDDDRERHRDNFRFQKILPFIKSHASKLREILQKNPRTSGSGSSTVNTTPEW